MCYANRKLNRLVLRRSLFVFETGIILFSHTVSYCLCRDSSLIGVPLYIVRDQEENFGRHIRRTVPVIGLRTAIGGRRRVSQSDLTWRLVLDPKASPHVM